VPLEEVIHDQQDYKESAATGKSDATLSVASPLVTDGACSGLEAQATPTKILATRVEPDCHLPSIVLASLPRNARFCPEKL